MERKQVHTKAYPLVLVAFIVWPLLLLSCSNLADSTDTDRGGPGIIIPEESIDGIRIADSYERVIEVLGPASKFGIGESPAWLTLHYKNGLSMVFFERTEDNLWGPVEALAVQMPYQGETPKGIGIGSTLSEIKRAYGEPERLVTLSDGFEYSYCHNVKQCTSFRVKGDTVILIRIGEDFPLPPTNGILNF